MAISDRLLSPAHFDVDRLEVAANDDNEPDLLFTVIEELLRCGSRELHLEQEAGFCRMRHRVNGQLTESRITRTDMVDTMLSRLRQVSRQSEPRECASFRISADNIDPLATIDAVYFQAAAGACLTLTLQTPQQIPETLDQLSLSAQSINALRDQMLTTLSGAAMVVSDNPACLQDLYYALLSEDNQLSGKTISVEHQVLKRVPRVVQISPPLYPDSTAMIGSAIYNTDKAYCDWQSSQSGSFYAEQLWQHNIPLASFHLARSCGAAMRDLINCAVDRNTLATRLQKVVHVRQVSTLCPHCADSHQPGPLQQQWLKSMAPIDRSDKPGVYFNAMGCSRCEYTGAAGKLTLMEIADCNDTMTAAIEARSASDFCTGFHQNLHHPSIATQAQAAAHAGTLSFDQYKLLIDSL
jgi:hypothetical protein